MPTLSIERPEAVERSAPCAVYILDNKEGATLDCKTVV
ncbi:Protein of unknown function [Bacillus wiedmannii]|nr:Protein of unknown function [Bacillus wiedmannii]